MHDPCLFIVSFLFLFSSAFSEIPQNGCQFNLRNGNWDEFNSFVSEIHSCVERSKNSDLHLKLENYELPAFANATFSNLGHIRYLSLEIENSRIQILAPSVPEYSIFQNSSFESVDFSVFDSSTLVGWNWKPLQSIIIVSNKGFKFLAVRSKLVYLHPDFGTVANGQVTEIRILKCGLRWLGEKVFAPLVHLKTLELRDNFLKTIKRSDLPKHAKDLRTLDLGNNRLKYLPDDIREGLNIQVLLIDGNNFKNLGQLEHLTRNNQVYNVHTNLGDKKIEEYFNYLNHTKYYNSST